MNIRKLFLLCIMAGLSAVGYGQALTYTPPPQGVYVSTDGTTWNPNTSAGGFGALTYIPPPFGAYCQASLGAAWTPCTFTGGGGGSGTVTSVAWGTNTALGGLFFTCTVASPTTAAVINCTLTNAAQNTVLAGPASGGAGAPSYQTAPTFSGANLTALNATQLTSGTVPTAATAALTGDVTKSAGASATTVVALNGTNLAALATGLLKNTTATGVPTIAVSGTDYVIPSGSITGNAGTATNILTCSDTSASGTAQSCTTSPSFTPVANSCLVYTTTTANTGAGLTLNVNALGAKSVAKWLGTTTLVAGDVAANRPVVTCYDGTNWELSTIGNAPGGITSVTGTANQINSTGGATPTLTLPSTIALPGTLTSATAGALSTPAFLFTGSPITGGSGTTTHPLCYFNGGTAPTTWSTSGTYCGFNLVSGFAGNVFDIHANGGTSLWSVSSNGATTARSLTITGGSAGFNSAGSGSVLHLIGMGTAPAIAAGAGAGTSPTVALVTATDLSGYITVTTGTLPTASAAVVTITFNVAYAAAPKCQAWPSSAVTEALVGAAQAQILRANTTTALFVLTQGATPLVAATAYEWGYSCIQ